MKTSTALRGLSRADWLRARMSFFGGSDSPALLGKSPFSSWEKAVQSKVVFTPDESSAAKERGNKLEPTIRAYTETLWNVRVTEAENIYLHESFEHIGVNLDGWCESVSKRTKCKGLGIVECKSTADPRVAAIFRGYWEAETGEYIPPSIPVDYLIQVQHALLVTGVHYGILTVEYRNKEERDVFSRYISPRPIIQNAIVTACNRAWIEVENRRQQLNITVGV